MRVLINAYAVSPEWGSEQGVGWNWVTTIAQHVKVDVITESEYKDKIEEQIQLLPQKGNITFHYIPVSDRVRRMCWNQGDYRFYLHYAIWQRKALKYARRLLAENHFDVIHMLNMVGYREPGMLWKIKDVPYVWGPMAGAGMIPLSIFKDSPFRVRMAFAVKNLLNRIQFAYSPRVRAAIKHSSVIITPVKEMAEMLSQRYGKDSVLIPETGLTTVRPLVHTNNRSSDVINLLWVGRFVARKKLDLAIRTLANLRFKEKFRLNIVGFGMNSESAHYMSLAEKLGVADLCVWHGKQTNEMVQLIMQNCDILFFTSVMEVTSTVVPEAISNRLPILCHDTCGFGPLVDDSVGWKIPVRSSEDSVHDFATVLDEIASSGISPRMIKNGFDAVASTLTYESKALKVLGIYNELVNE